MITVFGYRWRCFCLQPSLYARQDKGGGLELGFTASGLAFGVLLLDRYACRDFKWTAWLWKALLVCAEVSWSESCQPAPVLRGESKRRSG